MFEKTLIMRKTSVPRSNLKGTCRKRNLCSSVRLSWLISPGNYVNLTFWEIAAPDEYMSSSWNVRITFFDTLVDFFNSILNSRKTSCASDCAITYCDLIFYFFLVSAVNVAQRSVWMRQASWPKFLYPCKKYYCMILRFCCITQSSCSLLRSA